MQSSDARVDDESKKFLLDVKKGKPRKFVMLKDGTEIDRLFVFKKGPFERYIKLAKQGGARGETYYGVVRGDGLDIHFELSRSEGFNTPPGPAIKLKEFLRESTDFKFEPDYAIVDLPTQVEEDDQQGAASAAGGDSAPAGDAPQEDPGDKFIRLLKSILPHVKRALATKTSVSDELQASVREAQDLGRQRDFENGMEALRRVGALTKQALAEADAVAALPLAVESADPRAARLQEAQAKRQRQWEERIVQLEPRYAEALQRDASEVRKLKVVMDYAQRQAKRELYVRAIVGLDRLERLIGNAT